jgi:hypothetical protein
MNFEIGGDAMSDEREVLGLERIEDEKPEST